MNQFLDDIWYLETRQDLRLSILNTLTDAFLTALEIEAVEK